MKQSEKIGSVLVVGGGISGIQSSLDLAEAGYRVYLVEKSPAIGGRMAKLDKTFPTNDCAMCIVSPKLVDCGRHLNIDILSYAEVVGVSGKAGNFTVKIAKKARTVVEDKCTGCGECYNNCPVKYRIYEDAQARLPQLSAEEVQYITGLMTKYAADLNPLIPILQDINEHYNYLPENLLCYIAVKMEIPLSHILRIASFYSFFSLKPRGKYIISICLGTACHVKGSARIIEQIQRDRGIKPGETTADKRFTLEIVRCLGCCAIAPVMKIGETIFGQVKYNKIADILEKFK